jgi:hypothetical protein
LSNTPVNIRCVRVLYYYLLKLSYRFNIVCKPDRLAIPNIRVHNQKGWHASSLVSERFAQPFYHRAAYRAPSRHAQAPGHFILRTHPPLVLISPTPGEYVTPSFSPNLALRALLMTYVTPQIVLFPRPPDPRDSAAGCRTPV